MSIGMLSRWQAKIEFMIGIYWCARSPLTESMRMRERRGGEADSFDKTGLLVGATEDKRRRCLPTWVSARVRAPAMDVVGIAGSDVAEVVARRWESDATRVSWISRKGRYLFASSEVVKCSSGELASPISPSGSSGLESFVAFRGVGLGYRNSARRVWLAIIAILLA